MTLHFLFFFFGEADTKKHRQALVKALNAALVKLTENLIVPCFSVSDKHGQTSNLTLCNMAFNHLSGGCKESLYSQILLVHKLKFPVKKV